MDCQKAAIWHANQPSFFGTSILDTSTCLRFDTDISVGWFAIQRVKIARMGEHHQFFKNYTKKPIKNMKLSHRKDFVKLCSSIMTMLKRVYFSCPRKKSVIQIGKNLKKVAKI